ncbi:hypothetical protein [Rugamonas sp.]|uniref:arsenate reductase/protein-tyrosine-phosphatase family protein n=1 Tax=Rugamonas sp. TaxID=1926287 RepID=UPI0025F2076E|nr:hypothetical protein [Rugamonas sp.]
MKRGIGGYVGRYVRHRHGGWRGLARLLLARAEVALGRAERFRLRHPERVRRVVFVCLGNLCRSAYAEHAARAAGLEVASFGLLTSTGAVSPDAALRAARRQGVALEGHRACDWRDFELRAGDLLLVMELRQARQLRRRLGKRSDVQLALLGMWCDPPLPYLHDPFGLGDEYFDRCFQHVRQAVRRLLPMLPRAHARDDGGDTGEANGAIL